MTAPTAHQPTVPPVDVPKDPTRTGAVWVAGVGAFLIVIASAVFIASQWDQIPDSAKLGAIGLLTGGFLLAGRWLEPRLPATAGAMFHLGAFLVPIDVAAVAVHLRLEWPAFLLLEGLVCSITFGLLQRHEGSVLLRWAAGGSVVLLAGGVSAVSADGDLHLPSGLLLAGAATAALGLGCNRLARGWAVVAGLAPLAALIDLAPIPAQDVLTRFQLTADTWWLVPASTGVLAGAVLVVLAHRTRSLTDYVAGLIAASLGIGAGWVGIRPTGATAAVGLAALFVVVELVAMALRGDPFWSAPTGATALVAEAVSGAAILVAATMLLDLAWFADALAEPQRVAAALALAAAGWFVADLRRQPEGAMPLSWSVLLGGAYAPAAPLVALAATTAVGLTLGAAAASVTLLALAVVVVTTARPHAPIVSSVLVVAAPMVAYTDDGWVVGAIVAAAGTLLLTEQSVWHARITPADRTPDVTCGLVVAGTTGATFAALGIHLTSGPLAGLLSGVALLWAMGLLLDRAEAHPRLRHLAQIPRFLSLGAIVLASGVGATETALVAAVLVTLFAGDSVVHNDVRPTWGLVGAIPALGVSAPLALDLTVGDAGLVLTVSAVVITGIAMLVPVRWEWPLIATAGASVALGLTLSAVDPRMFAHALILTGVLVIGLGSLLRRPDVWTAGGAVVTVGIWLELGLSGVAASDAYIAPAAVLLVAIGLAARRSERISSWAAYGLPIALLGGAALLERVEQGSPWHALVAGAVGVGAVAIGGWRRLAAPLLLGTVIVVATAGYESLDITRGVPTWAWLAAGGAALLGAGVVMERREVGPIETGRRLVDVIHERFA